MKDAVRFGSRSRRGRSEVRESKRAYSDARMAPVENLGTPCCGHKVDDHFHGVCTAWTDDDARVCVCSVDEHFRPIGLGNGDAFKCAKERLDARISVGKRSNSSGVKLVDCIDTEHNARQSVYGRPITNPGGPVKRGHTILAPCDCRCRCRRLAAWDVCVLCTVGIHGPLVTATAGAVTEPTSVPSPKVAPPAAGRPRSITPLSERIPHFLADIFAAWGVK